MRKFKENSGFTLIELLLVVTIIGLMLAVIVPRAMRANVDAKYGNVRQVASELSSWAVEWAESEVQSQDEEGATATTADYLAYLCDLNGAAGKLTANKATWLAQPSGAVGGCWLANSNTLTGRIVNKSAAGVAPAGIAKSFVPVDKIPKNPFNQLSVFDKGNDPTTLATIVPGALAMGTASEKVPGAGTELNWKYFAFTFQGTDATTYSPTATTSMYANMDSITLEGLRHGIFIARYYDPL